MTALGKRLTHFGELQWHFHLTRRIQKSKNSRLNNLREGDHGRFWEYVDVGWLVLGLVDRVSSAAVLFVMTPWVVFKDEVDVVVECDRTVTVCCTVLLADTAEDALLILDPAVSGIWAVDVEFDEIGVAELFEEDSKEAAGADCADVGVDDDNVDEFVTADDELVASVIVNWITSTIQRNPRSIVV